MKKALIVYWSGTGNTQSMAEIINNELTNAGFAITMKAVGETNADETTEFDLLILGCPSMGAEVLEENEMAPFVEALSDKVTNKKIALFGSYDWGDGEWMRNWVEQMQSYGATVKDPGLIVNLDPGGEKEETCRSYAKEIAVM